MRIVTRIRKIRKTNKTQGNLILTSKTRITNNNNNRKNKKKQQKKTHNTYKIIVRYKILIHILIIGTNRKNTYNTHNKKKTQNNMNNRNMFKIRHTKTHKQ